jgi:hypothetical protein
MSIDCDDKEAETLAKRIPAYLISLGVIDVKIVEIEKLRLEGSRD